MTPASNARCSKCGYVGPVTGGPRWASLFPPVCMNCAEEALGAYLDGRGPRGGDTQKERDARRTAKQREARLHETPAERDARLEKKRALKKAWRQTEAGKAARKREAERRAERLKATGAPRTPPPLLGLSGRGGDHGRVSDPAKAAERRFIRAAPVPAPLLAEALALADTESRRRDVLGLWPVSCEAEEQNEVGETT